MAMTFDSTELQLTYDNTLGNMGEVCCGRECPVIQNALLRKPGPNAARRTNKRALRNYLSRKAFSRSGG